MQGEFFDLIERGYVVLAIPLFGRKKVPGFPIGRDNQTGSLRLWCPAPLPNLQPYC